MIKNGGNLCYKLDLCSSYSCRDTQASRGLAHSPKIARRVPDLISLMRGWGLGSRLTEIDCYDDLWVLYILCAMFYF